MPPTVTQAVEPQAPANASSGGVVRVAVALDGSGSALFDRILTSPSGALNASALSAAMRSRYSPAIFQCTPVRGAHVYSIDYPN